MNFSDPRLPPLYEQRRAIGEQIGAIESAEAEAETSNLVGRCFKKRNNYSCPKKPKDYWWLYGRVVGAEGSSIEVFQFQRDKNSQSEVTPSHYRYWNMGGWQEITLGEFQEAWADFTRKLIEDWPA